MALTLHRAFARDEVLPSYFVNKVLQAALAAHASNFAIRKANATTIEVPAGTVNDVAVISVEQKVRYRETTVQRAHPGGAAGTYDIYVVAKANAVVNAPLPNTDNTDYNFDLRITSAGVPPPYVAGTVDHRRKVGTLQWDGAAITSIDQDVGGSGEAAPHADTHAVGQNDPLWTALLTRTVRDVGQVGQTRAGRVLTAADFTDLGLAAPVGLWNLSDLTDAGGGARALTNKGAVPFGVGITGAAAEAAVFAGSTAQALYRADEAATSIATGAWGCWFRTAKRAATQRILGKTVAADNSQRSYVLAITNGNVLDTYISIDGAAQAADAIGYTDVCDDRWHFVVGTYDGATLRLYVDGALEATASSAGGGIFDGGAPFNIGAVGADGATAAGAPFYGRVDEAFLLNEVPTEDQIRLLMCVKLTHGAARAPRRAGVMVKRRRRGSALAQADFTALGLAAPKRIYNLNNDFPGSIVDLGSDNAALVDPPSPNGAKLVVGPNGRANEAFSFDGVDDYFSGTDTGLPAGTAAASMFAWFKTTQAAANMYVMRYGSVATNRYLWIAFGGLFAPGDVGGGSNTVFIADGAWHFGGIVFDPSAVDGVLRKVYVDGRLVSGQTTALSAVTLGGASSFRISASGVPDAFFKGQVARAVVTSYAMTPEQVASIYAKGSQDLGLSPYPPGDYVERLDATGLYVLAERGTLDEQDQVELEVAA